MPPDPKPGKTARRPTRIVDPKAIRDGLLASRECAACGRPAANGHHFLPRGKGGDDVVANIVGLCGSGTMGCHGAHHGNPYVVEVFAWNGDPLDSSRVERRDAAWVNERVGQHVKKYRPDTIRYVLAKLGLDVGRDWMRRTYGIVLTDDELRLLT